MRNIANYSHKGGVGKTTLALHSFYVALQAGQRTVLVDIDPQGNALTWASGGEAERGDGAVHRVGERGLAIHSPLRVPAQALRNHDVAVIDCPPRDELPGGAVAGAVRADLWVVPIDGRLAIDGATDAVDEIRAADARAPILLVLSRADAAGRTMRAAVRQGAEALARMHRGVEIAATEIPHSAPVARAATLFRPAWEVPFGAGTAGAVAMRRVVDEILTRAGVAVTAPRRRAVGSR